MGFILSAPKVLVISGYGLNCEQETANAFIQAGATADIVHLAYITNDPHFLDDYQIVALPGGFSFGDYGGAGNKLAEMLRDRFRDSLHRFIDRKDSLVIGICNGCQVLVKMGFFAADDNLVDVQMSANTVANSYYCSWVDLSVDKSSKSVWLKGIDKTKLPIAHGEGRFLFDENSGGKKAYTGVMHYCRENVLLANDDIINPSGSDDDVAAICSVDDGRVLAMMPHPERALYAYQEKGFFSRSNSGVPELAGEGLYGSGYKIFRNAVEYFA